MTEKPEMSSEPHPPGWQDLIYEKVDFRAAFDALKGYSHFHAETLRGFVRWQQRRIEDAFRHFDQAETMFPAAAPSPKNDRYLFVLRTLRTDAAISGEADDESREAMLRTDRELAALTRTRPVAPIFDQVRIAHLAYYNLIRGDFLTALESYEFLLEESRDRFETQQVGFSIGAAASTYNLDMPEVAEKHYENAALGANLASQPFRIAAFSSRLHALLTYWGRENEARDWLKRIEVLDCPLESRRIFIERAEALMLASRKRDYCVVA